MSVHTRHCCVLHGCKYNDEDCEVVTKKTKQQFTCEDCGEVGISNVERAIFESEASTIKVLSTDLDFLGRLMEYLKNENAKEDSTIIRVEIK